MPRAPETFRPHWVAKRASLPRFKQHQHERRGSARERGYDTRWQKARAAWLAVHPLCVCCRANGIAHPASVLDHIEPHKGDRQKFWDSTNWQGLCEWCDKNLKRSIENDWLRGRAPAADLRLNRGATGWLHPAER